MARPAAAVERHQERIGRDTCGSSLTNMTNNGHPAGGSPQLSSFSFRVSRWSLPGANRAAAP